MDVLKALSDSSKGTDRARTHISSCSTPLVIGVPSFCAQNELSCGNHIGPRWWKGVLGAETQRWKFGPLLSGDPHASPGLPTTKHLLMEIKSSIYHTFVL